MYCGKPISVHADRCPFCREAVPRVQLSRSGGRSGREQMRRGLLYMLLAAVIYYFEGGYSSFKLPVTVVPLVNNYFAPLLFLGGLAFTLYGLFLRIRS